MQGFHLASSEKLTALTFLLSRDSTMFWNILEDSHDTKLLVPRWKLLTTTLTHWLTTPISTHWFTTPTSTHWLTTPTSTHWLTTPTSTHWFTTPTSTHWLTTPTSTHWFTTPTSTHWSTAKVANEVLWSQTGHFQVSRVEFMAR